MIITKDYLLTHPSHLFVFGDNTIRKGLGGGARLRYMKNSYGFITKKFPDNIDSSFYRPEEYFEVYKKEIITLKNFILCSGYEKVLISKLGGGLANKYNIFENIILPNIKKNLKEFENIVYLF